MKKVWVAVLIILVLPPLVWLSPWFLAYGVSYVINIPNTIEEGKLTVEVNKTPDEVFPVKCDNLEIKVITSDEVVTSTREIGQKQHSYIKMKYDLAGYVNEVEYFSTVNKSGLWKDTHFGDLPNKLDTRQVLAVYPIEEVLAVDDLKDIYLLFHSPFPDKLPRDEETLSLFASCYSANKELLNAKLNEKFSGFIIYRYKKF